MASIYLDYSATCPVDHRVAEAMQKYLTVDGQFGNPASRSHRFGWMAEEAVDIARNQLASLIGADSLEIIFTSGATESNNLAIKGIAGFYGDQSKQIITTEIEHKSVLATCRYLEQSGFQIIYLKPNKYGLIEPSQLKENINKDTLLVSIMHVNNEIGVIQQINELGEICRSHDVFFHVDGAQAVGKIPVNLSQLAVDLYSISAHKMYGPKGVGALYIKRRQPRIRLEAVLHGGGQERGLRSGTLPVHQIVGMGVAAALAQSECLAEHDRQRKLRHQFLAGIDKIEKVQLNGHPDRTVPHIVNLSFPGIEGEALMLALPDIAISSGSACTSENLEPSYVLRAIGVSDDLAHSSLRFSFGKYTQPADLDKVVCSLSESVKRLRELSPIWELYQQGRNVQAMQWNAV